MSAPLRRFFAAVVLWCASGSLQHAATPSSPEIAVVRASLAAFNARDADAVVSHYADDITWTSIGADGKTSVDGDSRESIRKWLVGYFKSLPDIRSEITDVAQTGAYVSFRERATYTAKDGTRRVQSSLGVYEVRDGKIKRAWYFPAVREPAPSVPSSKP